MGYSPRVPKELDTTEWLTTTQSIFLPCWELSGVNSVHMSYDLRICLRKDEILVLKAPKHPSSEFTLEATQIQKRISNRPVFPSFNYILYITLVKTTSAPLWEGIGVWSILTMYSLKYLLKHNVHTNLLGILLRIRFWFSQSGQALVSIVLTSFQTIRMLLDSGTHWVMRLGVCGIYSSKHPALQQIGLCHCQHILLKIWIKDPLLYSELFKNI